MYRSKIFYILSFVWILIIIITGGYKLFLILSKYGMQENAIEWISGLITLVINAFINLAFIYIIILVNWLLFLSRKSYQLQQLKELMNKIGDMMAILIINELLKFLIAYLFLNGSLSILSQDSMLFSDQIKVTNWYKITFYSDSFFLLLSIIFLSKGVIDIQKHFLKKKLLVYLTNVLIILIFKLFI